MTTQLDLILEVSVTSVFGIFTMLTDFALDKCQILKALTGPAEWVL